MSRARMFLVAFALAAAPANAAECAYRHPDLSLLPRAGARLILLPPRARIVDTEGRTTGDAPGLAARLVPELHCRLEEMGHDVDGHSLSEDSLAEDAGLRVLADRAWRLFDERMAGLCLGDVTLDPDRLTLWEAAPPLAARARADALVMARASAVVKTKGARAFARTLERVAPDLDWPGPDMDVTWIEVAIVDGASGRLLAHAGAAEHGDVSRHPAGIVSLAIERALHEIPRAGESGPSAPSRVLRPTPAFERWQRRASAEVGERSRLPRATTASRASDDATAQAACASLGGSRTILITRHPGPSSLLVTNDTAETLRVRAGSRRGLELGPGDAMLLDLDPGEPLLVVEDLEGRELARAGCPEAFAQRIEARIVGARGP